MAKFFYITDPTMSLDKMFFNAYIKKYYQTSLMFVGRGQEPTKNVKVLKLSKRPNTYQEILVSNKRPSLFSSRINDGKILLCHRADGVIGQNVFQSLHVMILLDKSDVCGKMLGTY